MQIFSFATFTELSLVLCVLVLTVTFILLQEQRRLLGKKSMTSVSGASSFHWVNAVNFDVRQAAHLDNLIASYNFQQISVVHSLPQALLIWALLLFAAQYLWMAVAGIPLHPSSLRSFF